MKILAKYFILLFVLTCITTLHAQEEGQEMSPEMQAWMEYMTPGWAHDKMAKSVGEWKTESTFWQYPGAEPEKSEGIAKNEMTLGGRYLTSHHTGTAMGMPFEGMSIMGYDNAIKKFKNVWIDNMGTGISTSIGTYDKENNSITFMGTMVDPVTNSEMTYRAVDKIINDNKYVFEMYMEHEGKEFKSMEIISTRK
jgi:hypothetical protein